MELYHQVEGEGPAVLLIHAGICDSRMWDAQWSSFTAAHRLLRSICADSAARRCRPSPTPTPATWPRCSKAGGGTGGAGRRLDGRQGRAGAGDRSARARLGAGAGRPRAAGARVVAGRGHLRRGRGGRDRARRHRRGHRPERPLLGGRPRAHPDQVDPTVRERVQAMQRRALELQRGARPDTSISWSTTSDRRPREISGCPRWWRWASTMSRTCSRSRPDGDPVPGATRADPRDRTPAEHGAPRRVRSAGARVPVGRLIRWRPRSRPSPPTSTSTTARQDR